MNKRLLKVAVTTALTVAFAVPAFANPFSDVPAKHWAYDAVNKLAKAGVVTGFGDGTYKGDKTVSRYEMASMIATAMQKSLNNDQKETVDKLSKEFATELNEMGVKIESLDKKVDNMVKISGDARVRYGDNTTQDTDFRARVNFDGKISDNLKFNARLTTGNIGYDVKPAQGGTQGNIILDTANVTFNALGLTNTIGRQDLKLGNGFLFDTSLNAVATQAGGLKLVAGRDGSADIMAAQYGTNLMGAKVTANYMKKDATEFYGANTSFNLLNGVTANAEFYQNSDDAKASAYGVKINKLGLSAMYRDVDNGMMTGYSTLQNDMDKASIGAGFKGMEYQLEKAIDKNANLVVKYQDFEKQDGTDIARTQATVNVKF
ncbi:S-layer homology domain-containing protein [Sporomusa malonica]|uniref:S-layer homology domain-containing protein n=1 Tax=Sporomusa malonica TaxID=112901 RepID=A0A1W1YRU9_9FIRM|nr:S-layer homology domain-containing protein [Sporomusa malonica]SMC38917.1 S-layer homology domain-containing protein [Sporomusa malonica]